MSSLKINKQNMHMNIYLILDDSWCLLGFEYSNVTALKHTEVKKIKYLHLLWCFWHSCLTFHCFFDFFRVHFPPLLPQHIGHCRLVIQVSGKMYSIFHEVLKKKQEKTRFASIFSKSYSATKLFRLYHDVRAIIPASSETFIILHGWFSQIKIFREKNYFDCVSGNVMVFFW